MKARKKPVVIDAYQLGAGGSVPDWFMNALTAKVIITHSDDNRSPFDTSVNPSIWAEIKTLEGTMRADNQDWIIRGVNGEVYPCKPDIFAKTYDIEGEEDEAISYVGTKMVLIHPLCPACGKVMCVYVEKDEICCHPGCKEKRRFKIPTIKLEVKEE